jgi:hypothetical protein
MYEDAAARLYLSDERLFKGGKERVLDVTSKRDRAQKPEGIDLWRL